MSRSFLSILFLLVLFYNNSIAQQESVILYPTNEYVIIGDTLSVKIKVNGFSDGISFQSSINWDPTILKYLGVSEFGISDFSENNFGITQAAQGHVRFLWEPSNSTPLSVEDGTTLFSAQFEIITQTPQETAIGFVDISSTPAYPTEFANGNYEIINVTTLEGNILVIGELKELVNIKSIPNTSCDEKVPNGGLEADVLGDFVNYSFHWYNGNSVTSTPDHIGYSYTNIPIGIYTLQVFDGNNDLFVESMTASVLDEVPQATDIISVNSTAPQTSCNTDRARQTGAIEININDDQAINMYNISWWENNVESGQELIEFRDLFVAEKLSSGEYEVAVKNTNSGCKNYLKVTVLKESLNLHTTVSSTGNNFCSNGANGSASISVANSDEMNPRYYWFYENDEIDTAHARFYGPNYDELSSGTYKAWVIDLNSDCSTSATISVNQDEIYPDAIVTLVNDTLFANDTQANWYRNNTPLQVISSSLIPDKSGGYSIAITNEYGCTTHSEIFWFGITGLHELNDQITLFPNPFTEFIRIANENGIMEFVKIYDTQGSLIKEYYNIKNKFIDLYLSDSPEGTYLINIRKDGKMITRKVVKNLSK